MVPHTATIYSNGGPCRSRVSRHFVAQTASSPLALEGRKQLVVFGRNLSPSQKHEGFHQGDTGLIRNDSSKREEPPSSPRPPGNAEQRGDPVSFVPGSTASRSTCWIRSRERLGALGELGGFHFERAQTTCRLRKNTGFLRRWQTRGRNTNLH